MGAVYWSIPLFVMAIIVAVTPVLYGTLRHRQWEEAEQASVARAVSARDQLYQTRVPVVERAPDDASPFEMARQEAAALLERLEQLRAFFAPEEAHAADIEPAANAAD
jgi:hypothetical protein